MKYIFIIAAIAYGISIFIDVSVYHLKYYIQDNKNIRHLLSLINIFQYCSRGFIMIFMPMMAFLTESVKDKQEVWFITLMAHFFATLFLLPLFSYKFTYSFSKIIIYFLNRIFGKSKFIELIVIHKQPFNKIIFVRQDVLLFVSYFIAGILFSFSITFLFYISFSFPQKALMLSSMTQVINMFGSILLIMFIDPKIMGAIDEGGGYHEIRIVTSSRVFVHIVLFLILLCL